MNRLYRYLCTSFFCLLIGVAVAQAATFTVNSTSDSGDSNTGDDACNDGTGICTLRAAIEQANASTSADDINFNIGSGGIQTISPGSPLPIVNNPVTIDGTTQPGFSGNPIIELNGSNSGGNGLVFRAENSTVRGLVINRFSGSGIALSFGGGNVIEGNFIGTDVTGMVDLGNDGVGVAVASNNNTIGGTTVGARNVISGNNDDGVELNSSNNVIQGNFIGTDVTGMADLSNDGSGIHIVGNAPNNIIGGTTVGAGNVISGNVAGVNIEGSAATGNVVQGNYIGTDATGMGGLGNTLTGVNIGGASNNRIGGILLGARNLIAANGGNGVVIRGFGAAATGNMVQGNHIGTDITGTIDLGNGDYGMILAEDVFNSTIGGMEDGAGNIIAFSGRAGIVIVGEFGGTFGTGNAIFSNTIFATLILDSGVVEFEDGVY